MNNTSRKKRNLLLLLRLRATPRRARTGRGSLMIRRRRRISRRNSPEAKARPQLPGVLTGPKLPPLLRPRPLPILASRPSLTPQANCRRSSTQWRLTRSWSPEWKGIAYNEVRVINLGRACVAWKPADLQPCSASLHGLTANRRDFLCPCGLRTPWTARPATNRRQLG